MYLIVTRAPTVSSYIPTQTPPSTKAPTAPNTLYTAADDFESSTLTDVSGNTRRRKAGTGMRSSGFSGRRSDPETIESDSVAVTAAPLFSVPVSTATAAVSVEEPPSPASAEPVVLTLSVADAKSTLEVSVGSIVLSFPDWPETDASDVVPVL